jgi:hypothetical protein
MSVDAARKGACATKTKRQMDGFSEGVVRFRLFRPNYPES